MSDDNNSTEGLNREEERSDENSVASSQLRDFMISDNAYSAGVDSKEEKEEVGSRNPVELTNPLAEETLGSTAKVTILNTSEEDALRSKRKATGGNGRRAGGPDEDRDARFQEGEGEGVTTGASLRRALMRESLEGLHRADLSGSGTNSSYLGGDASTQPLDHESSLSRDHVRTHRSGLVPHTPDGLSATRLVRQPTTLPLPTTFTTMEAGGDDRRQHPTVRSVDRDKTQGSGPLSSGFVKPRNVEEPKRKETGGQSGSRGVRLDDDFYGEEEEDKKEKEDDHGENMADLERDLVENFNGLLALHEVMTSYTQGRRRLVEAEGHGDHPEVRERLEMVERLGVLGTCVPALLTKPNILADLGTVTADLWITAGEDVKRQVEAAHMASKDTENQGYSIAEVRQMVQAAGVEMGGIMGLLKQKIPREALGAMCDRHDELATVLGGGPEVTKEDRRRVFPRDLVNPLTDWYVRALPAVREIARQQQALEYATLAFVDHLKKHPVPIKETGGRTKVNRGEMSTITSPASLHDQYGGNYQDPADTLGVHQEEEPWQDVKAKGARKAKRAELSQLRPEDAALLGSQWRMSAGIMDDSSANRFAGLNEDDLESGKKSKKKGADKPTIRSREEALEERGEEESGLDSVSLGSVNWDRTAIKELIGDYVLDDLEKNRMGQIGPVRIISENLPLPGEPAKRGSEYKLVDTYTKAANSIQIKVDHGFFNMYEWLKEFNSKANEYKFTIPIRIRMFEKCGGMEKDEKDETKKMFRDRIIQLMSEIEKWLPEYDITRDETDYEYWLYIWVDICLKWVKEFYRPMEESKIEKGTRAKMKEAKYKLHNTEDALNDQWVKVDQLYKDILKHLENMDSAFKDDPGFAMRIMREEMRKSLGPVGIELEKILGERIKLVIREPEKALPLGHGLSSDEIKKIKRKGATHIPQEVYRLILNRIVRDGSEGLHKLEFSSTSEMQKALEGKEEKRSKKKEVATMAAVTDTKPKGPTGQTQGGRGGGGSNTHAGRGGGSYSASNPNLKDPACSVCGMYCPKKGVTCEWTMANGKLDVGKFIIHPKNQHVMDGVVVPSRSCLHKLNSFYFTRQNNPITEPSERAKVIAEVRTKMASLPVNPALLAEQSKQVNFVESEGYLKEQLAAMTKTVEEQGRMMALAAKVVAKAAKKKKESKKKESKKKKRKARKRDESDSDSDEESAASSGGSIPTLISDTSSEDEEDSN